MFDRLVVFPANPADLERGHVGDQPRAEREQSLVAAGGVLAELVERQQVADDAVGPHRTGELREEVLFRFFDFICHLECLS
jgi:hypothetical protein